MHANKLEEPEIHPVFATWESEVRHLLLPDLVNCV
jgi:hypothetical protein